MEIAEQHTDQELATLLGNESSTAFVAIYNRYWAELYTAAFRRLKSKELSEEILQDLFTTLWVNRFQLQINTSLRAYLHQAIRNQVLNYFEKEEVRQRYRIYLQALSSDSDDSVEAIISCNDLAALLDKEVGKLPEKCREVYQLSRQSHLPNKEIAAMLHISEKTVESHLTKALKTLKVQLKDAICLLLL